MYGYTREQFDNKVTNITDLILPEDREKTAAKVRQIVLGSHSVNHMLELTHTEDREYVRQKIFGAIKTGKNTDFEYCVVRPDGRIVRIKAAVSTTNISGFDLPVQITIYSNVTEEREHNMQLSFLNETVHEILAQPDCDKAVSHTLGKIRGYFAAERAYVIETDSGGNTVSNTYEVCAPGAYRARLKCCSACRRRWLMRGFAS